MKIKFLGATETVTGSKYLLKSGDQSLLIDCGLFQGKKELRLMNRDTFPVEISTISAVVLTHAHLDHSGYLPLLIKKGFRGPVYSTSGTRDLCKLLLPDSGKLQEEEASYANKRGFSKHHPALPLYTKEDAEKSLQQFETVPFEREQQVGNFKITFYPAGHILGSACVRVSDKSASILFSGDVGRPNDLIMRPPREGLEADYLVIESTYGDRVHEAQDPFDQLETLINRTVKRKGVMVIPAFAVGRSQALLYAIYKLKDQKRIEDIPVFLNSPMAVNASGIYCDYKDEHRLSDEECKGTCGVARYVSSVEESKALNKKTGPMIIVSASGMATGGRVVHHLKAFAPDPKNMIVLSGFQAAGTRGAALAQGAKEIKIHGGYVPVLAEVVNLNTYSAHADKNELQNWLKTFKRLPKMTFITHGEASAAGSFKSTLEKSLGLKASIPTYLQEVELT